jgi:hypothetical protein
MLQTGYVVLGIIDPDAMAHVRPNPTGPHTIVINTATRIGRTLFDNPHPGDVGHTLGHEVRHVLQFDGLT